MDINWNLHLTSAKDFRQYTDSQDRNKIMNEMIMKYGDDPSISIITAKGNNGEGIIAIFDIKIAEQIQKTAQSKKEVQKTFVSEGGIIFSEVSQLSVFQEDTNKYIFGEEEDNFQIPRFFTQTEPKLETSEDTIIRKIDESPSINIPTFADEKISIIHKTSAILGESDRVVQASKTLDDLQYRSEFEDTEKRVRQQYLEELKAELSKREEPKKKKGLFDKMKSFLSNIFRRPITDPALMLEESNLTDTENQIEDIRKPIIAEDLGSAMLTPAERTMLTSNKPIKFVAVEKVPAKEIFNGQALYEGPHENELIEEQSKKKTFEPNIEELYGQSF